MAGWRAKIIRRTARVRRETGLMRLLTVIRKFATPCGERVHAYNVRPPEGGLYCVW